MGKIEDLISTKIEVTFRGEKYTIESGFTLEETPAINMAFGQTDSKLRAEGLKQLLKVIVKRLFPDATDDQVSKVDAKYSSDILEVFYQLDETDDKEQKDIKATLNKVKEPK